MKAKGKGKGIPFFDLLDQIPYSQWALRYLKPKSGSWVFDVIGDYDAFENSPGEYDMNPLNLTDPAIALQLMDKSDVSIWSETDKDGNTIRDLPGYNVSDPFEWLSTELNVDFIDTYINSTYRDRVFANFTTKTSLIIYSQDLSCPEMQFVHNLLETGGRWLLNRGIIDTCGIIKSTGIIRTV